MSDGKVQIDSEIDDSGVTAGVNKITATLNKLSKSPALDAMSKLGNSINGVSSAFSLATKAINKVNAAIKDCSNASNVQLKAEKQLSVAVKNNPYLNSESETALKNYASQLQTTTAVGDETLLPFMAELASAGRDEAEIMDIMSASLDIAATGSMSLDSAVQSLNRSYSGEVGMLGRVLPQVKDLSEEQLKNGEATKLIKESMGGMAKEIADSTGSSQKLANAWGDLKETLGTSFNKALNPMQNFFATLIQGWADARKARQEYEGVVQRTENGTGSADDFSKRLEEETKRLQTLEVSATRAKEILSLTVKEQKKTQEYQTYSELAEYTTQTFTEQQQDIVDSYDAQKKLVEQLNAQLEEKRKLEEKAAKDSATKKQLEEEVAARDKLRETYRQTIEQKEKEIEARKKAGEEISEEEEAQEMYNTAFQAYVDMYSQNVFDRSKTTTGTWAGEADQLKQIAEYANKAKVPLEEYKDILDEFGTKTTETSVQSLELMKEKLEALLPSLTEGSDEWQKVKDAIEGIDDAIAKSKLSSTIDVLNAVADGFTNITDAMDYLQESLTTSWENEEADALENLTDQYEAGLISYEDYVNGKEKLDKEYADKKYKLDLAVWAGKIADATASIATGIATDLQKGQPLGAILAATTGALGAAQLASIIAAKPVKGYATGGIIGATMGADNTIATVRTGEMVLNAQQQKELWATANGQGNGASIVQPINIVNNTSAKVDAQVSNNQIKITVNDIVQSSINQGLYDNTLAQQQANAKGRKIL